MPKVLQRLLLFAFIGAGSACAPPDPEVLMTEARAAIQAGELRTADIHLKNLLRQDPADGAARALLGEVSLSLGDPIGAEVNLERAIELGVDPRTVQLPLLRALLAQGKFAEVLEQGDAAVSLSDEQRVASLRMIGAAHRALGAADAAEAAYQAALALDPVSSGVQADLAQLLLDTGRVDEARELVDVILGRDAANTSALTLRGSIEVADARYDAAEATFRQVMDLLGRSDPAYSFALSRLVAVLLAQGRLDDADVGAEDLLALSPSSPIARFLKASVEARQGQLDAAERRLEPLVAEVPDYSAAVRLLGSIKLNRGQMGQARMYLQNAVAANPRDGEARLLLAEAYLRQGDIESARQLLSEAVPYTPSDALMLALAGSASLRAGNADQAASFFQRSEETLPADAEQALTLASVYEAAGELDRAMRVLEGATVDDARHEALVSSMLAVIRARQRDLSGAAAAAERAVALAPDAAWPLRVRGAIAAAAGDFTAARSDFQKALEIAPADVPALLNIAGTEMLLGRRSEAAGYLRRVMEIDPGHSRAAIALVSLAIERGEFTEAREWLAAVTESGAHAQLAAAIAVAEGRYAEAAESYRRAYELEPSAALALRAYDAARRAALPEPDATLRDWMDAHPADSQALFALGSYEFENGELDGAVARFEQVLEIDPSHVGALNNLALAYDRQGRAGAMELAERAYAAAPSNAAVADTLGWLRLQRGDATGALPLLEQAAEALPQNREVAYHLAVGLAEVGDSERAAALLEETLRTAEPFPGRADAQQRFAELLEAAQ